MITAVDTNVLLDVFGADESFGERSAEALRRCSAEGRLVACEVVLAEVASAFPSASAASEALETLRVEYEPVSSASALASGEVWRRYRERGGRRVRLVADFLVGAHATRHADRLLTRDRGFYRSYFSGLEVVDPSTGR